jgi:phosphohistidine phosphatase
MLLYLLRHAHALDSQDDDARLLSPQGRRQVERLAAFLARSGAFAPSELWHSPLTRARETAAHLAAGLRLKSRLVAVAGMRPEDDPAELVSRLTRAPEALALVGHEPYLSALASFLLTRETSPAIVSFEKCALLALEGADGYWTVRWHLAPELLE